MDCYDYRHSEILEAQLTAALLDTEPLRTVCMLSYSLPS